MAEQVEVISFNSVVLAVIPLVVWL